MSFGKKRECWAQFIVWLAKASVSDIAKKLNLTELSVQACIAWILRSWDLPTGTN